MCYLTSVFSMWRLVSFPGAIINGRTWITARVNKIKSLTALS